MAQARANKEAVAQIGAGKAVAAGSAGILVSALIAAVHFIFNVDLPVPMASIIVTILTTLATYLVPHDATIGPKNG